MLTRGAKILQMVQYQDAEKGSQLCAKNASPKKGGNDSESELDSEQERIAKEMEEFISFSTSGSEYVLETTAESTHSEAGKESLDESSEKEIFTTLKPVELMDNPIIPTETVTGPAFNADLLKTISIGSPSMPDYISQYERKGSSRDRPTICPLCFDDVPTHFSRHIFRIHKDNKDVLALQNEKPGSKERLEFIRSLRKQGYFIMKTERNVLRPVRSSKNSNTEYFACTFCLGHYSRRRLSKHVKTCKSKPISTENAGKTCLQTSQTLMASIASQNEEFLKQSRLKEEVFGLMRADDISFAAKSDPLVCLYGEALLGKHKRKQIANVISNKMREMGRLLIALRTVNREIVFLFDALKPEYFRSLLTATKIISGYDSTQKCFTAPSLALHMGTNLKFLCNIGLKIVMEKRKMPNTKWTNREEKKMEIKDLKKLIEGHWCTEISSLALKTLKERHWEKPVELPLNSDIQLFNKFVNEEAEKAFNLLKNDDNIKCNYKILIECVLAETLMFNRKRIGEIQYLTIERYQSNTDTVNKESFMDSLTDVEKLICKKFKRVVAGGKGFKPVPILFSKKLQLYIDLLLKKRQENNIVPPSNPYLFANPHSQDRWMSGANVLRKIGQRCGAKEPSLLTSTRFRKHIATTLQLMTMEDNEMEQIATFMGHTKKTHAEFYRLPQDIYQTAKVAKVLLLLEKGKGKEFKGKRLNEIELEQDIYVTTDSEQSDQDEPSGSNKFLKRLSKKRHITEKQCETLDMSRTEDTGYTGDKENESISETRKVADGIGESSTSKFKLNSRRESASSSDDEISTSRHKLKKPKVTNRKKWSENEKRLVTSYFSKHIAKKIPPKKHECEEFLSHNKEVFTDKCWVRVKTYVYNCYRNK